MFKFEKWPNVAWPIMANYEITEGHGILIIGSTPTNKAIVLLLSYIMTPNVQY